MPPFVNCDFHHERTITLFKNICSFKRKGKQFHRKVSCRYNRNRHAVRAEYAKKGFLIEIDDAVALPSKNGFIPPSAEVMQAAIEKYCEKNHHKLTYIRLEDPIVFMLDDKEAYEAKTKRMNHPGLFSVYVIKCTEFK